MTKTGSGLVWVVVLAGCFLRGQWGALCAVAPNRSAAAGHWAFQSLPAPAMPATVGAPRLKSIDEFISARLRTNALSLAGAAGRSTLIRRVAFSLTGLPPSPGEVQQFLSDQSPVAYERMVDRFLASPHYGEHWGKYWLDAAGYADSNGYFNADSDRPLAYRYRDYVIRSLNRDKPFDRFVQEQLAGDELAGWKPGQEVTPQVVELLEATHFLRNGQDGSGESDGNPDEVRTDRYYALESAMQIIGSSLLGLTIQCAKCHDHKFEPVTQMDYYSFQAFLYPAFNIEKWVNPNQRVVEAGLSGEAEAWKTRERQLDGEQAALRRAFSVWITSHRPPGRVLFADAFREPESLTNHWSNTAPGDDAPGGTPPVVLGSGRGPGAMIQDGALRIIEGGGSGDRWICTQKSFDWRPPGIGQWIQAGFDLIAIRLSDSEPAAERVGYFLAAHDFNDNSTVAGGNILIDGNPGGATAVQVDYPGADAQSRGAIGSIGYQAGRNYGVRITRTANDVFTLEHLVDGVVDGGSSKLKPEDLPPGAFGFEYCCGRSFVVDNVVVEASNDGAPDWVAANANFRNALGERQKEFEAATQAIKARRTANPARIAWMTDSQPAAPEVHLLKRGNHKTPGESVEPAFFSLFATAPNVPTALADGIGSPTTGRRLAWARWLTQRGSRPAALLARVTVNRSWQQIFGVGLVPTPENFGLSGAPPTHPELIDWLAAQFVESGWSLKSLHRLILHSATFRQASAPQAAGLARDPANRLLWRYPLHRLTAESVRDAMLAAGGRLGGKTQGPYVPTLRTAAGEIVVDEAQPDGLARSVFLQQKRTQMPTFLGNFDAPSLVFNCTRRAETTMPLQSLSLLNSEFALERGRDLARRLERECGGDVPARIRRAFLLVVGREPDEDERQATERFLEIQRAAYQGQADPEKRVWADYCQTLLGLNAFLYIE